MAFKFNLKYLEDISSSASNFVLTLKYYYFNYPVKPYNVSRKFDRRRMVGYSWLSNAKDLLLDNHTDPVYIVQYVKLAGLRDLALYQLYGDKSLDLSFYPDINIQNISHNPLLSIKNNRLYFKYEE